ncbi:nuclear transport factor 2 family protein [Paraburkholderia megapolitana]|uniref:nuclear transport factor 2 family protein n=1 Tax=Paraburkholderia megapolitana TaxID=420953 RepID=UPI0011871B5B|nr:hypothetical protein FNZ07_12745 [Paraburkholderia megapolitana]
MNSRLEAEQHCRDLMVRYCLSLDAGNPDACAELFAKDGGLEILGARLSGREPLAVLQGTPRRVQCISRPTSMPSLTCKVVLRKGAAILSSTAGRRGERPHAPVPMPLPLTVGMYYDRFIFGESGWRIAYRRLHVIFSSRTGA